MSTITVTTAEADGPTGTKSLQQAVAEALASAEADTIRFDFDTSSGPVVVGLGGTLDVTAAGGALTIDGDVDGDGITDVVLQAGDEHHLTVQTGAQVTLRNLDFIGGEHIGENGETGETGADGEDGEAAVGNDGYDGAHATDVAGDGAVGGRGEDAEDVAGSIVNHGDLTLVRVGFSGNHAGGGFGGEGGIGGDGGAGAWGADGLSEVFESEDRGPAQSWDAGSQIGDIDSFADLPSGPVVNPYERVPGGDGGTGGTGGAGGAGGRGGDGGDAAAALMNGEDGTLRLVDVTFGGLLGSGLMGHGNTAYGGPDGRGGRGGEGGAGGKGGDGGAADWSGDHLERHDMSHGGYNGAYFYEVLQAGPAGLGGFGGAGGRGGNGGPHGDSGAAATLLNDGVLAGSAAFTTNARSEAPESQINNEVEAGTRADTGVAPSAPGFAGTAGSNGDTYDMPMRRTSGISGNDLTDGDMEDWAPYEVQQEFYRVFGEWLDAKNEDLGVTGDYWPTVLRHGGDTDRYGPAGGPGEVGALGAAGGEAAGILDRSDAAEVETGQTLVYLHDLGRVGDALVFNVFRTGNSMREVSVNWRIEGVGDTAVSGADFAGGALPGGTVGFATRVPALGDRRAPNFDREAMVQRIEVAIAGDLLDEGPEGYRIVLDDIADATVALGTASAMGHLDDTGIEVATPAGTSGDDVLTGSAGPDFLEGLDGADRLLGMGGNDTLEGGDGPDTINGGDGNDLIRGGDTDADRRDVIYGGAGNDSIDAGHGNDLVYGQGGNDTIAGGFGADELQGQDGNDVITGSAFGDIVFGNAGDDFVNGGFGHDLINGGTGADKFFHVGGTAEQMEGHGSDWVQDYSAAEGDILVFGGSATAAQFQVNLTHTANKTTGERSGDDDVEEAFVIYKPTGQILWALVDGGGQAEINLQIGGDVFNLLG